MSVPLNQIKFYDKNKEYYEFTNFAEGYPINFPSLPGYENLAGWWKTSEHLFQAAGFRDRKEIVERFRKLTSARAAFNLKQELSRERKRLTDGKSGWHGTGSGSWEGDGSNAKKIEVMRLIVEQKFRQHEKLKKMLLETGAKEIIEESPYDNCWGNARGGKNWLGKILVEIREKLRTEEKNNPPPPNNPNPSPQKPEPNKPEPETPSPSKDQPSPGDQNEPPVDNPDPQKNNNPPSALPPTNAKEITEAKNVSQARAKAKNQIKQFFQKSNLRNFNLKKELQNWENQLENLNDKQKIIELVKQIETEINQKLEIINRKNTQTGPPSKPNFPLRGLILIIGGSFFLACGLTIYIIYKVKKEKEKG
ncbi:MAG: DUF1768 domain-containing protein [Candidatus Moeniiplasma glomeromycotorum]|nr:DUF1768 domain-containing protein [Candidatus Moeniiplasma glomeromycotorum]MCE8167438.1 DUF1768 domain-containing protein [Candidatus Moeniiplasma glomeromycotorum]MCE8168548.1 DUF1768 domain-containing protein [Candidatus Moeniiplasma glomeromycotorum]